MKILKETSLIIIAAVVAISSLACSQHKIGSQIYVHQLKQKVIVDCDMTLDEAMAQMPEDCPKEISDNLALVEVFYYGFDHRIHRGQLLCDYRLASDIQQVFNVILDERFPIYGVVPIDHSSYEWKQFAVTPAENTYSFHYRNIVLKNKLSYHGYGHAIDINPVLNPFRKWGITFPEGGTYNPEEPGTLYEGHPVVVKFKELGWYWGGNWRRRDYQHFQKPIKGDEDIHIEDNPEIVAWPDRFKRPDGTTYSYSDR